MKQYFIWTVFIITFLSTCTYASSISNNFTAGPDSYYYDSLNLSLDLSKDMYAVLGGSYSKEDKNSWVGSKNYSFSIGGYSNYGSIEAGLSIYKSQNTYENSSLNLTLNMNLNNVIKGEVDELELLLKEEDSIETFITNIYFGMGIINHRQDVIISGEATNGTAGQISLTFGINETVLNNTVLRLYYSINIYSVDLKKLANISYPYIYNSNNQSALSVLSRVSGFPLNSFSAGASEYLFDILTLSFDYSYNSSVLASPSRSYNYSVGIQIFKWLELNGSYNLNAGSGSKSEYISIGSVFRF